MQCCRLFWSQVLNWIFQQFKLALPCFANAHGMPKTKEKATSFCPQSPCAVDMWSCCWICVVTGIGTNQMRSKAALPFEPAGAILSHFQVEFSLLHDNGTWHHLIVSFFATCFVLSVAGMFCVSNDPTLMMSHSTDFSSNSWKEHANEPSLSMTWEFRH